MHTVVNAKFACWLAKTMLTNFLRAQLALSAELGYMAAYCSGSQTSESRAIILETETANGVAGDPDKIRPA